MYVPATCRGSARAGTRTARGRSSGSWWTRNALASSDTPGRVLEAADRDRALGQPRLRVREHRTVAQDLVDRRVEVLVAVARVDLVAPAAPTTAGSRASRSNAHASCDAVVSWPATSAVISSSRSSSADIGEPSSWRACSSIARMSSPSGSPACSAARRSCNQLEHQLVGAPRERVEPVHRPHPPGDPPQRRQHRQRALAEREHAGQRVAQLVEPRSLLEAEDGAQDDLEREALQPRVQRHGHARAARSRSRARRAASSCRSAAASSRRGRRAASACAARGAAPSSSRITELRPTSGSSTRAPSPGCTRVRRRHEQLLDVGGIRQDHERRLERQLHRDPLSVAAP